MSVRWDDATMSVDDMINEGVRRALEKLYRRTDRPRDLLEILEALVALVAPRYSGARAKETVAFLDQFVRWPGNPNHSLVLKFS